MNKNIYFICFFLLLIVYYIKIILNFKFNLLDFKNLTLHDLHKKLITKI